MKNFAITQHLKILGALQPAQNKKLNYDPKLPIYKIIRKGGALSKDGIFVGLTVCAPLLDQKNDLSLEKSNELISMMLKQGAKIIEFDKDMREQTAKLVMISGKTNPNFVKRCLLGRVVFEVLVRYEWAIQSLRKLKKQDYNNYLVSQNTESYQPEKIEDQTGKDDKKQLEIRQSDEEVTQKQQSSEPQYKLNQQGENQFCINKRKEEEENAISQSIKKKIISNDGKIHQKIVQNFENERDFETYHYKKEEESPGSPKAQNKSVEITQSPKQNKQNPQIEIGSHSFKANHKICDQLKKIQKLYNFKEDKGNWAYIRAIGKIGSHKKEILTPADVDEIDISQSFKTKVKQFIRTGVNEQFERMASKGNIQACNELSLLYGIGSKVASKLYQSGIKDIATLRQRVQQNPSLLTNNQKIYLNHYEDLSKRIPRETVTRMFEFVRKVFVGIVLTDKCHHISVVGSYRRGRPTCGDVDILVSRIDGGVETNLLLGLVNKLKQLGFMKYFLSTPKPFDGRNSSAFMGVCYFQDQYHRIDIKHYPINQYPFALLYFTGSDVFNRTIRNQAHKKGLMLSDKCMKQKERNGRWKMWKGGEIPTFKTEQEIFEFMGMKYCPPEERDI